MGLLLCRAWSLGDDGERGKGRGAWGNGEVDGWMDRQKTAS